MKKYQAWLLILLALFLIGVPAGYLMREVWREETNEALITAVKARDTKSVAEAIKGGADPNAVDTGNRPLSFQERFQHWLDRFRNPDSKSDPESHPSALMLAVTYGLGTDGSDQENPDVVRMLLDHGANPNYADSDGYTPIMGAAFSGYNESIRLLLASHADLNARGKNGLTALSCADRNPETIRLLIQYGVDTNVQADGGVTPLMLGLYDAKPTAIQALIDGHADVNHRDKRGHTALDIIRSYKQMYLRRLNTVSGNQPQSNAFRSEQQTRLANANATEQILLKAGAKTGKELSTANLH